jgi:hypothetical protein
MKIARWRKQDILLKSALGLICVSEDAETTSLVDILIVDSL